MGMLVFGSLAYYIENEEEDTGFYSIPQVRGQPCLAFFFYKHREHCLVLTSIRDP
jgi:hypothetical protein